MPPTDADATLAAIDRVGKDVRDLRIDLTGRLDQMVTRNEHLAEVRRIDAEAARTKDALTSHEGAADRRLAAIQEDISDEARARAEVMAAMVEAIKEADDKRETALVAVAERRRADRRFIVATIITAVAAASGATGVLVSLFGT